MSEAVYCEEAGMKNTRGQRISIGQMIQNAPMTKERALAKLKRGDIVGAKETLKWHERGWI